MELGCPHPDYLLRMLTKAQLVEWMAYATLEPVGNPVEVKDPEAVQKTRRARVEGGLRQLMEKSNANR